MTTEENGDDITLPFEGWLGELSIHTPWCEF